MDAAPVDWVGGNHPPSGRRGIRRKRFVAREELRRALEGVLDIERLLSRVTLETANPRDVLALCASLNRIPHVKVALARLASARLDELHSLLDDLDDLRERIEKTIVAE